MRGAIAMSIPPVVRLRVVAQDGDARRGVLVTPHGEVPTPTFMPVGTAGSVKTLTPDEVRASGAGVVLGNTYHLWLRPGPDIVAELGGLHGFSRWTGPMLTDSGGYQAFSIGGTKMSEDGFSFRSHINGDKKQLSPEEAMRIQRLLGADIAMQLDVCPPGGAPRAQVEEACRLTTRWAARCLDARRRADEEQGRMPQAVFGIVQGGLERDLRLAHADELAAMPFEGLALGGFSVGEPIGQMHELLADVGPALDAARPRYLMGVGTLRDLVIAMGCGIDMFDCVLPTRNARNGQAVTRAGRIVIKNSRYKSDPSVLDPSCACPACRGGYSRGYLRHLFMAREILALRLLSIHNLFVYGQLMRDAREAISEGRYAAFTSEFLTRETNTELA
jgi:queuine tRNA-ribosyltransferase